MSVNNIVIFISSLVAALVIASCTPPTEEEIQEEFDRAVENADDCETDADCVLVMPGCPLGCGAAVNVAHEDEIRNLARRLIAEYEVGGRSCDYGCMALQAVCTEGACEAIESGRQPRLSP
jgi:hypothetical protein